jgi:hypothetical protein
MLLIRPMACPPHSRASEVDDDAAILTYSSWTGRMTAAVMVPWQGRVMTHHEGVAEEQHVDEGVESGVHLSNHNPRCGSLGQSGQSEGGRQTGMAETRRQREGQTRQTDRQTDRQRQERKKRRGRLHTLRVRRQRW